MHSTVTDELLDADVHQMNIHKVLYCMEDDVCI